MTRSMLVASLFLLGLAVAGCGQQTSQSTGSSLTPAVSGADVSTTGAAEPATTATPTTTVARTTTTAPQPSAKALTYAKQLGGTSHNGQSLYFLVGASVKTEAEAQALLDKADPLFGDMQSYFIVQRSDNFQGMAQGWWVVIEAYRKSPSDENLDFGRRGFPGAYVKRATVRTSDPIPVYEDLVGGAGQ